MLERMARIMLAEGQEDGCVATEPAAPLASKYRFVSRDVRNLLAPCDLYLPAALVSTVSAVPTLLSGRRLLRSAM